MVARNVCTQCYSISTPKWRRDPTTYAVLCNRCGLRAAIEFRRRRIECGRRFDILVEIAVKERHHSARVRMTADGRPAA